MNLRQSHHEEVVVAATLIERADLSFLGVEDPLHGLTGGTDAYHIVLRVEHILTLLNLIAELGGILLKILNGLVLTHILAELVISIRVGGLREVDGMLDESHIILVDHSLAGSDLKDNVALGEL